MNRKGFSLIEMMMVLGIMGVVATGFITFMKTQNKGQQTLAAQGESHILVSEMRTYLGKYNVCANSLVGKTFRSEGLEIQEILRPSGKVKYKVGDVLAQGKLKINALTLENYEEDTVDGLQGRATLFVSIERLGDVYGNKVVKKEINLDIVLDTSKRITSCYPAALIAQPGAINNIELGSDQKKLMEQVLGNSLPTPTTKDESQINDSDVEEELKRFKGLMNGLQEMIKKQNKQLESGDY